MSSLHYETDPEEYHHEGVDTAINTQPNEKNVGLLKGKDKENIIQNPNNYHSMDHRTFLDCCQEEFDITPDNPTHPPIMTQDGQGSKCFKGISGNICNLPSDGFGEELLWLLDLGDGRLPIIGNDDGEESFTIRIPERFLIPPGPDSIGQIVDHTYPNIETNYRIRSFLKDRAILSTTNEIVDTVNDYVLSRIPEDPRTYLSADFITPGSGNTEELSLLYPTEFLNSLKFTGVPNHSIVLKKGVPIILLRNINQNAGLCNGTRMIVTGMYNRVIEAETITGRNIGERYFIPRVEITPSDSKWPFSFTRRQFPIKVCFAMTINKSQGQTFENVGVYLPRPVFTHGQLYVAASRVTTAGGLKMLIENENNITCSNTDNVVYKEVFDDVFRR